MNSIEYVAALNNLGLAYLRDDQSNEALNKFQICLRIQQEMKSDDIEFASTLNNIGLIYFNQGYY